MSRVEEPAATTGAVDRDLGLRMLRQMLRIRRFEEHVRQLCLGAKMPGLTHLYIGEEAVAVGVCTALRRDDWITSTHRGHGHCLAKGADVARMFAERHVGQVEKPFHFQVARKLLEVIAEMFNRQAGALGVGVDGGKSNGENAGAFTKAHDAIVVLRDAQRGHALVVDDGVKPVRLEFGPPGLDRPDGNDRRGHDRAHVFAGRVLHRVPQGV